MSQPPRGTSSEIGRRRRKRALGAVAILFIPAGVWVVAGANSSAPAIRVTAGDRTLLQDDPERLRELSPRQLRDWLSAVPPARRVRARFSTVLRETDYAVLGERVQKALSSGGSVEVPTLPVWSSSRLPVVKQALRNNCETAALSMLLAAHGKQAGQLDLQRSLARNGPLDPAPVGADGLPTWGDPDLGYVGRPEGGGEAGGYGVYEPPIEALAQRHGVRLTRLSRRDPGTVYAHVLSGRPVMAWVGLSDGPYRSWRTLEGKKVTGNLGEHTVVLTGLRDGRLAVNDPLSGNRLTWSRAQFELMWRRLGSRALAA